MLIRQSLVILKSETMRKNVPSKRCQNVFRALILFGVLAGLLFSGGEGIHLLPFPAETAAENRPLRVQTGKEIVYQKNVHRFESKRGDYFSKDERANNALKHSGSSSAFNHSAFSASTFFRKIESVFNTRLLKSRIIVSSKSSRAPPLT